MDLSRVCCQGFHADHTALDSDDKVSPRTLMCGLRSVPNSWTTSKKFLLQSELSRTACLTSPPPTPPPATSPPPAACPAPPRPTPDSPAADIVPRRCTHWRRSASPRTARRRRLRAAAGRAALPARRRPPASPAV